MNRSSSGLPLRITANHAAGIVNETTRALTGAELTLDEDVPTVFAAALEHMAGDLVGLADRALKARTAAE